MVCGYVLMTLCKIIIHIVLHRGITARRPILAIFPLRFTRNPLLEKQHEDLIIIVSNHMHLIATNIHVHHIISNARTLAESYPSCQRQHANILRTTHFLFLF